MSKLLKENWSIYFKLCSKKGIVERAKRERAMSPFLAWGDFQASSRFTRSTIPEEKWGTTRSPTRCKRLYCNAVALKFRFKGSVCNEAFNTKPWHGFLLNSQTRGSR